MILMAPVWQSSAADELLGNRKRKYSKGETRIIKGEKKRKRKKSKLKYNSKQHCEKGKLDSDCHTFFF